MKSRRELLQPLLDGGVDYRAFHDWEVVPGFIDGEHAATAIVKGTEVHFGVMSEFRGRAISRRRTQEFLGPLLDRHGYLTTRVQLKSHDNQKFVERIGFKPTWSDGQFQYYLLGRLPFQRS